MADTIRIDQLTAVRAAEIKAQLVHLLQNIVDNGSSVGFLRPLPAQLAESYWSEVFNAVAAGHKILLVALRQDKVAGSVQAELCQRQNGLHRAEIQKLMVLTDERRNGIARQLMMAIEAEMRQLGRTTLFLDTVKGKPAETVYELLGWTRTGSIPDYAVSPDGEKESTMIFYKLLDQPSQPAA